LEARLRQTLAVVCSRNGCHGQLPESGGDTVFLWDIRPNADRLIFPYAFAKSEKDTISDREEAALSIVADSFVSSSEEHVAELLEANLLWEVSSYE